VTLDQEFAEIRNPIHCLSVLRKKIIEKRQSPGIGRTQSYRADVLFRRFGAKALALERNPEVFVCVVLRSIDLYGSPAVFFRLCVSPDPVETIAAVVVQEIPRFISFLRQIKSTGVGLAGRFVVSRALHHNSYLQNALCFGVRRVQQRQDLFNIFTAGSIVAGLPALLGQAPEDPDGIVEFQCLQNVCRRRFQDEEGGASPCLDFMTKQNRFLLKHATLVWSWLATSEPCSKHRD
jgi:hypothetical protein